MTHGVIVPLAQVILAACLGIALIRLAEGWKTRRGWTFEVQRSCPQCADYKVMITGPGLDEAEVRADAAVDEHVNFAHWHDRKSTDESIDD